MQANTFADPHDPKHSTRPLIATTERLWFRSKQPCWRREPKVYVAKSCVHGLGLFAKCSINTGDIMCRYTGPLIKGEGEFVAGVGGGWGVDSSNEEVEESGRWCNHSITPNAKLYQPEGGLYDVECDTYFLYVICMESIDINDEIFIDYGPHYFETDTVTVHNITQHLDSILVWVTQTY